MFLQRMLLTGMGGGVKKKKTWEEGKKARKMRGESPHV